MATRAITWPLLILALLSWGAFLAGIICLQNRCSDGTTGEGLRDVPYGSTRSTNTMNLAGVMGWSPILPCNRLFRFAWFIIAFGLVTLVGACVAAVPKYGLRSSRSFWIGMFSILTVLYMIMCEATLSAFDVSSFVGYPCMRVAFAGALGGATFSILLLLGIGTDWEDRSGRRGRQHRDDDKYPRYGLGGPTSGQGAAAAGAPAGYGERGY